MKAYIFVKNTAAGEIARFQEKEFETPREAKAERDIIRKSYSHIGCHEVKLLMELYPDKEV